MTKIGYSHLKELGDLNGVLKAKTEAFAYMKPGGIAVLNGDDDLLWGYEPGMRRIMYGVEDRNDFRADNVRSEGTESVVFDVVSDEGRYTAMIPSYGSHLASVALSAAAVGRLLGLSDDEVCEGLLSFAPVGGRSNVTNTGFITLVDDCYNSNPNSVKAAISSLSSLPLRRVAILGDMFNLGVESDELHRGVGAFAAQNGVDCLLCCGNEALFIYEEFKMLGTGAAQYFNDKSELIEVLPEFIKKGDAVLVKASRGMQFDEFIPILKGMNSGV